MKRFILFLLLLITLTTLTSTQVKAQSTGPTFFYVVTAQDTAGFESVFSNEQKAVFVQGTHNAVGTWVAPTVSTTQKPLAGYNVYRGTSTGGPYTKVNTTLIPVGTVTYTDTFVPPSVPTGSTWVVN